MDSLSSTNNITLKREKELLIQAISNQSNNPKGVTFWTNTSTKNHKMDKIPQFVGNRNDPFEVAQHLKRFGIYFNQAHPYSSVNGIWPNGLSKICFDPDHAVLIETVISTMYSQVIMKSINRIETLSQGSILEEKEAITGRYPHLRS